MSDGTLSQDEIDALLQDAVGSPAPGGMDSGFAMGGGDDSFSGAEIDALKQILTEVINSQTSTLKGLFQKEVTLANPRIEVISASEFDTKVPIPSLEISFPFTDTMQGDNIYFFKEEDAIKIGAMMMAQEGAAELTGMISSAVAEAVSQMVGSAVTTISNKYKVQISTGSPQQIHVQNLSDAYLPPEEKFILVTYNLSIDNLITNLYHIMSIGLGKSLANLILSQTQTQQGVGQAGSGFGAGPSSAGAMAPQESSGMGFGMQPQQQKAYQPAVFSNLEPVLTEEQQKNISLLLDVEMEVTVEIGRTRKTIKDILQMGEGTIISLDRLAGEPIDILVNGKKIAKGEVIVIEENFGVRITEILSKTERLSSLS